MFSIKKNGKGAADKAPVSKPVEAKAAEPIEREVLKDFAKQLGEARQRVTSLEAEVARLQGMIEAGAKSEERLADLIGGEVGPDDALMRSSVALEISARAAAKRLPVAKAALEDARRVAMKVEADRNIAARNLLLTEAAKLVAQYRDHWRQLCALHDEIAGVSAALPPLERGQPEIANSNVAFEAPNFNLGSSGTWSPVMRHIPDPTFGGRWSAALAALHEDADADFRAVLDKPVAKPPASHLPPGMTAGTNPASGPHAGDGTPVNNFGLPFAGGVFQPR
jgi:hypothetical protein